MYFVREMRRCTVPFERSAEGGGNYTLHTTSQ
jgi:hypothetical protein